MLPVIFFKNHCLIFVTYLILQFLFLCILCTGQHEQTSVPTVDPSKPLQEQFPVSCGSKHREKEVVDGGAGILANVDGSAILSQPKSEIPVFAPPSTEVKFSEHERLLLVFVLFAFACP